jgi:hypothetical protein
LGNKTRITKKVPAEGEFPACGPLSGIGVIGECMKIRRLSRALSIAAPMPPGGRLTL